jgi:pimeloyl-ACP methyl ester carboxylesterase
MLGVEPLTAVLPQSTMQEIVDWVSATESQFRPYDVPTQSSTTVFKPNASMPKFQERSIEIGPRHLFGIVTEPTAPGQGPLLVLLNVANEEHTGPSRLWVDLSRQWAGVGLRSVRFDLSGLGDSPGGGVVTQRAMYDPEWLEDVCDVARALSANDPTNVVYVGLCSGAFLAIEGALAQRARGVVAINPPVAMNFLHFVTQLEKSNRSSSRAFGKRLKRFVLDRRWDAAALWETFQLVTPSKFSVDVIKDLRKGGTELLLLSSVDDFSPYRKTPFFRSIDLRRLVSSPHSRIEIVPGLDHSMHAAKGRELAVKMIDQHVREHYASSPRRADSHTVFTEEQ